MKHLITLQVTLYMYTYTILYVLHYVQCTVHSVYCTAFKFLECCYCGLCTLYVIPDNRSYDMILTNFINVMLSETIPPSLSAII